MKVYSLKAFWPDGISVNGVCADHGVSAVQGISPNGVGQARKGRLSKVTADGLVVLLAIASDFAGRPVKVEEIIEDAPNV